MVNCDLFMGRIWLIRIQTDEIFSHTIEEKIYESSKKDDSSPTKPFSTHRTRNVGTTTNRETHTSQAIRQETQRREETRKNIHSQKTSPRNPDPINRVQLHHKSNRQMVKEVRNMNQADQNETQPQTHLLRIKTGILDQARLRPLLTRRDRYAEGNIANKLIKLKPLGTSG